MPSSLRRRAAHLRAAYTRETHALASAGIDRHDARASSAGSGLGLDACTTSQRRLRALLALGLLNHGPTSTWPRNVSPADVTRYTLVVSARHDNLVLTTRAPYNVACWLVSRNRLPQIGLPGLRVETSYEEGWRLLHLPTGAALTVTSDRNGRLRGPATAGSNYAQLWTTGVPLTAEEHAVLNALPPLGADTETLLAALTVRLCAHAPDESWDVGTWFSSLAGRPDEPELDPVASLRYLNAIVSQHPYDLEPVPPVVTFDLTRYRIAPERDVVAGLDSRPDLVAMDPIDFEHLIRRLFEKIGLKSWVTQASRDDGIDAVAVNEEPLIGGLCIIQAKRTKNVVSAETVRSVAGIVNDKSTSKGIVVTTAWFGKASWDFAPRNRVELIDGRHLKSLLLGHLGIDALIGLPKLPPGWQTRDLS
ncbi:restriction endonuclease [Streptomyces sp. DH7]|uniref:restriction endonuclease n=1 Tax=Streptomyces sp. DH7 TaxID=2857006 RepID=UPI001E548075|nr:restriction endonuclease [Streptomyces sp. DH7]